MNSNLPPGVTDSMLPGNRREDIWWDKVLDELDDEVNEALENISSLWSYSERFDPTDDPNYVAEKISEHYHKHYKQEDDGHD